MRKILFTISAIVSFHFCSGQDLLSQNKTERLYKTASDLIDHHQFGAARETWDKFLSAADKGDPRRVEAEYLKAFYSFISLALFGSLQIYFGIFIVALTEFYKSCIIATSRTVLPSLHLYEVELIQGLFKLL